MAELELLKAQRKPIKAAITRFTNAFEDYDQSSGLGTWRTRLEKFEPYFDKYDAIQTQIEMLVCNNPNAVQAEEIERETFEFNYFDIVSKVRDFVSQFKSNLSSEPHDYQNSSSSHTNSPVNVTNFPSVNQIGVNLPTITLHKFDGALKDWLQFRDTFKSLIHENARISSIQKFHYLNSTLRGDAARVIQSLGVSDLNYELAWKALLDRYEDSRSLLHHHTKSLFELPTLTKSSYVLLRQLIDDASNHLLALRSLGENTDAWDTIIIHLITTKLDLSTKFEWEKQLLSMSEKPKFMDMLEFLELRCKYLQRTTVDKQESASANSDQKKQFFKNNHSKPSERLVSHATAKRVCPLCSESHPLYKCEKLLELSVPSRIQEASRLRVCFNCLSPGHRNKQCTFVTMVSGVGKTSLESSHRVSVTLQSRYTAYSPVITCLVTAAITDDMPDDSLFTDTRPVDLLISGALFWKLLCVGQIQLRNDQPIIQKIKLGWIVAGPMERPSTQFKQKLACNLITNQQLHDEVKRFWEIEHFPSKQDYPALDSRVICEQHFRTTTKRDSEGRFVVALLFNELVTDLGESFQIAQKRLISVERKLARQPEIKNKYN